MLWDALGMPLGVGMAWKRVLGLFVFFGLGGFG